MRLRKDFVMKALSKEAPIAELCRQFGVSRKTGYKWLERFRESGFDALVDGSRRPTRSPLQIPAETAFEIVRLRRLHPTWGARKLQKLLARTMPASEVPSERSVRRVLERAQLIRKRRMFRKAAYGGPTSPPRFIVAEPNDLWTADFKGWWRAGDGERCDPLTIRDAHSRFVFALQLLERTDTVTVRVVFERLFEEYGLPKAIQTDNGPPFVSMRTLAGLTKLSAWWVSLGIQLVRSRPGCPQDNGAHERMHADVRVELQANAADTRAAQQAACDEWRLEFNHVRPHEALDYRTPAEVYHPSTRRRSHVILGGYPDGCHLLMASKCGQVRYLDKIVYTSNALAHYQVGLLPVGPLVQVWFHELLIGAFDPNQHGRYITALPIAAKDLLPKRGDRVVTEAPPPELLRTDLPGVTAAVAQAAGAAQTERPPATDGERLEGKDAGIDFTAAVGLHHRLQIGQEQTEPEGIDNSD